MACEFPVVAYYSKVVNPSGKRSLVFRLQDAHSDVAVMVPCQFCINCRLQRSALWSARSMHELRMSSGQGNCFITLTYDDVHLPPRGTLVRRHPQLFLKRLRKAHGAGIRFFGCGEYGETYGRPHYHVILFNFSFSDGRFYKESKTGEPLYRSAELSRLWSDDVGVIGECNYGYVTEKSIKYVAGYVTKKVKGPRADAHYQGRLPEFAMYSSGLGKSWFYKYFAEVIKRDSMIVNSVEVSIPRYYNKLYVDMIDQNMQPARLVDTRKMAELRLARREKALQRASFDDQSMRRRATRERFAEHKAKLFKRDGA